MTTTSLIGSIKQTLLCGLAALIAGGLALTIAAGPAAANGAANPVPAPAHGRILFAL
ncbi:hypothetical protein [Parapedomonas caeni]|jgi:hypothetical protein